MSGCACGVQIELVSPNYSARPTGAIGTKKPQSLNVASTKKYSFCQIVSSVAEIKHGKVKEKETAGSGCQHPTKENSHQASLNCNSECIAGPDLSGLQVASEKNYGHPFKPCGSTD
jgi:hypothetical protein